MNQGFLNPRSTVMDNHEEEEQVDEAHDEEGQGCAYVSCQPEGKGKREEHQHGDDDEEKENCQGGSR